MYENDEPIEQTVVQDEAERLRSKERSSLLSRPEVPGYEVETLLGDASMAKIRLGWHPTTSFEEMVELASEPG